MNQGKIVVRYSKALFDLAVEKNILDKVYNDMAQIASTLQQVKSLSALLNSPVVPVSKKQSIVKDVFAKANPSTLSFLNLVIAHKRETYLKDIARYFDTMYNQKKGIREATIITAMPIDVEIRDNIFKIVKGTCSDLILQEEVNPDIIGGYVLRIDDRQYDASISHTLKKMKTKLLNTSIK